MSVFPMHWFKKVPVTHDGLCGYRSVAHLLLGDEKQAGQIIDAFLQLLGGKMALLPDQRFFLQDFQQAYDLFLQKSKAFKGWDSKYWLTSDILDVFAKSNGLVFLILKSSKGRRREYEVASVSGDYQALLKGDNISVYYLNYQEDKFDPLTPAVQDGVQLTNSTMQCLRDIEVHSVTGTSDSARTSLEDASEGLSSDLYCSPLSPTQLTMPGPVDSPLLFDEVGRARSSSAAEVERELSASPERRVELECIKEKLKSFALPKGPKNWSMSAFHECREDNPFLQLPGGRVMQVQRVSTTQRPMNRGGRRLYTCDLLKARALYNVWQYFAVSDAFETWVVGTVLWPKSEEPVPATAEELSERLQALDRRLEILGGFWTTNCGKDVEVIGNLEDGFTQFKENPKVKLTDYICLDFLPIEVTLERIITCVHDMVDKSCLRYDKSRSDVQFFGRSPSMNEDASSDSEPESCAKKTVQRQFQGKAISFVHDDDHQLCSLQNNLGDLGVYFNAIKAGAETVLEFGSLVTIDGLKSNPPTRFLYAGCLETGAPVDASAKFNYFVFCTVQRALFCTQLCKMRKVDGLGLAVKKDTIDANNILVAYIQESASRSKRSMRRLPTASSETVLPMSQFTPKKEKVPKIKPELKQKKFPVKPAKMSPPSRKVQPPRKTALKPVSPQPSDELAQLQAKIEQLQKDLSSRNYVERSAEIVVAPKVVPQAQVPVTSEDSAEIFFEYFFFENASRSFGSWKRLYDQQYQRFCISRGLAIVPYKYFKAASLNDEGDQVYFRQRSQSPGRSPRVKFMTDDEDEGYSSNDMTGNLSQRGSEKNRSVRPKHDNYEKVSEFSPLPPPQASPAFSSPQHPQYTPQHSHFSTMSAVYGSPYVSQQQHHPLQPHYAPPLPHVAGFSHHQYAPQQSVQYPAHQPYSASYPPLQPPQGHVPFGYGHY